MPWRYGIVKFRSKKDPDHRFYGIGELFYDDDPLKPWSCTEEPIEAYSDDDNESEAQIKKSFKWSLENMLKDSLKYPIFDIDGPYSKAPWDGKKDLDSLTQDEVDGMTDEELEFYLNSDSE